MATLSDKYVAGFLDADGCVGLNLNGDGRKPTIYVTFSQRADRDRVIRMIHEQHGGSIIDRTVGVGRYTDLTLRATAARKLLNRIAKHLVIKRAYAYRLMELEQVHETKEEMRWRVKEARTVRSLPLPNFPPRKWLAGYFDGDGCVSVNDISANGNARLIATIATQNCDTEGLEIIQKNFGGMIYDMAKGRCKQWRLLLQPSKALHFLGYFARHSIVKRDQIDFILGRAAVGPFSNGHDIKAALKRLKANEHRLSESGAVCTA